MSNLTLGSLFDGSGGFPLAGLLNGIRPVWASEVEPFPIRVTTKRLPMMRHLGDINRIDGATVPPVDIITGGFCCQDLSVAGKRAGLHGERSGLFFQITRIVREMRAATGGKYPTYAVLENVPGIYSSGDGRDFLEVLNELGKIKDETVSVPMPENGKWSTAGEILGDGFSIAWRTLDAQFFGVAQRRRRCFIVVDFAGERAGEILFDESRLRGHPPQGGIPWQDVAGYSAAGAGSAVGLEPGAAARLGGHCWDNLTGTLRADAGDNQAAVAYGICSLHSSAMQSPNPHTGVYEAKTSRTLDLNGGRPDCNQGGIAIVAFAQNQREEVRDLHGQAGALAASPGMKQQTYVMTAGCFSQVCEEIAPTLQARDYKDAPVVARQEYVIRRLTPVECALLQGFPADWCAELGTENPTDDELMWWSEVFDTSRRIRGMQPRPKSRKWLTNWLRRPNTDAAEYKMWGNGIALPCAAFVLAGIAGVEN